MYVLEFFELGIDLGLDEVEGLSSALVLSGNCVELVERADGQEADQQAGEDDCFHEIK